MKPYVLVTCELNGNLIGSVSGANLLHAEFSVPDGMHLFIQLDPSTEQFSVSMNSPSPLHFQSHDYNITTSENDIIVRVTFSEKPIEA